jgi:CelD/BcsL family acetyltransferase involved in cellulose biosynthesis
MSGKRLDVSIKTPAEMAGLQTAWADLCGRCLEDNVYYTPTYAGALLATVARHDAVKFIAAHDGPNLVALLPVVLARSAASILVPSGRAWMTDYTFGTLPLIDKTDSAVAAHALLDGLRRVNAGEWLLPAMNIDGPTCKALGDALSERGFPWSNLGRFERASISTGRSFEDHLSACISSKRRRDLERCKRRLEEAGEVRHEVHTAGEGLDQAVAAFLQLEASGWKGKRGTALASQPDSKSFAEKVFAGSDISLRKRVDLLVLNGRPVAAGMILFSGNTGFTIKGAYDEAYAKFSVGLLLEMEVIRSFLSEAWASRLDAATAGDHVIDQFWPDRVPVGGFAFSLAPVAASFRLRVFLSRLVLRQQLKEKAKKMLGR